MTGRKEKHLQKVYFMLLAVLLILGMSFACSFRAYAATPSVKYTVRFYDKNGSSSSTYSRYNKTVAAGTVYSLPTIFNKKGYTFLGWSLKKNQTRYPDYQPGQYLKVNKNTALYAVWFPRSADSYISRSSISKLNRKKYTRAIIIGDSRCADQRNTLRREFGSSVYSGITYIAEPAKGYSWLNSTAGRTLTSNLKRYGGGTAERPVAVIMNLGINDMSKLTRYINYMKGLRTSLAKYHVKLFYVSLNPINSKVLGARGFHNRTELRVLKFNNSIRKNLKGICTYIDTHSSLIRNGFAFDSGLNGWNTGRDDGIHYSANTSKRIYNMIIDGVNAAK